MATTIKSFKGFNKDLKCRDFQYEVGKTYKHEGNISVCNSGFHACENPFDVLNYYSDIDGKYCEVEQSGNIQQREDKIASSEIRIVAEIGFAGLFKAGVEWIKKITNPQTIIIATKDKDDDASGYYAQIGSSGYYAQIGSSGYSAQIGSSGYSAQIDSTGEDSVICCAGDNSKVKASKGSWITLSEWEYDKVKKRNIPKCVKTEFVDGERIKADTWYELVNGEFKEV
jgi:hypothetical protein